MSLADALAPPVRSAALARLARPAMFLIWFAASLYLALHHVMWRDEVRALSIALRGDGVLDMLVGLRGEGHPALWYLMLRGAHAVYPHPEVLALLAFTIGCLGAALPAFRAPFPTWLIGLLLGGHFLVYEFTVSARNYGLAMVVLFAIAAWHERLRASRVGLGLALALLANCNVPAAVTAGGYLVFWFLEAATGPDRAAKCRHFALNAVIAAGGFALCIATIYPTVNDAALQDFSRATPTELAGYALLDPGAFFYELLGYGTRPAFADAALLRFSPLWAGLWLFAAVVGLRKRPAALTGALAALWVMAFEFAFGVDGSYRHHATWFIFLVTLYWICARDVDFSKPISSAVTPFLGLAALQTVIGIADLAHVATGGAPESRSREFAAFVQERPELKDAVVMSDPDFLIESLPYYLGNPTFLTRSNAYGNVTIFSRKGRLDLSLSQILTEARDVHAASGKPVIVLLAAKLDEITPPLVRREGYNWTLSVSAADLAAWGAETKLLARFGPSTGKESYDAYVVGGF